MLELIEFTGISYFEMDKKGWKTNCRKCGKSVYYSPDVLQKNGKRVANLIPHVVKLNCAGAEGHEHTYHFPSQFIEENVEV